MNTALAISENSLQVPFKVPASEQIDFMRLSKTERLRILDLLKAFEGVKNFKGTKQTAFAAIAAVNLGRRGFSAETLDRLYSAYIKSGCKWQVLTRNYRGGKPGQPAEFKKFFCSLVLKCQGRTDVVKAARDDLIFNFWKAGKSVPGYGTFFEFWQNTQGDRRLPRIITDKPPHTPEWSYRTLCRIIKENLSKEVRVLSAMGDLKAHNHQVQLFRDRTGLMPLQYVTFDDVELDIQVLCKVGKSYHVRPLQAVMALDIATANFVAWGVRPMLKAEDLTYFPSDAGKVLTRKQVNHVLMQMILNCGLPENYPIRLLMENNSAALNAADRNMLETILPWRIVIENTRMFKESYLGIECKKHGLPYQKGFIESVFQGLHTRIAGLPGALSPRYEFRNPAHKAIADETMKVLECARAKGIKDTLFKFKLLTYDEFLPIFDSIVFAWNSRTDHKLQGFDYEYETIIGSDFYRREDAVKMLTNSELEKAKFVRRMESPQERWLKLAANCKFTKIELPMLFPLLQEEKRFVKVRNGQIAMDFSSISPDKFYYRSEELAKYEGREFIAVTCDREILWLFNKDEGFVCAVPRLSRISIADQTAIIRQSGIVHRERQIAREKVEEFLADRKNTFKEIDVHNARILEENAAIGTAMATGAIRTKENNSSKTSYAAQTDRFARQAAIARNDEENEF